MSVEIFRDQIRLDYKNFVFPGGEIGLKLDAGNLNFLSSRGTVSVIARIQKSDDLMVLAMAKNALENLGIKRANLYLPYVPYGRQDRICDAGEAFSLKVFAQFINLLNFDSVIIVDPHSEVSAALFNNVKIIAQSEIINKWQLFIERVMTETIFVSPDAGANKKTFALAKFFGHVEFLRADKMRDLTNGNIKETIVYAEDLKNQDIVIADDICDGGRTFIELAKVLKTKNAGKIILYITHGIFSKGEEVLFAGGIDEIWTTNSFKTSFDPRVKVFDIESLFK